MGDEQGFACCGGKGCCGDAGGMDRRAFMKTTAAAAGTLGLLGAARAQGALTPEEQAAFDAWNAGLLERGARRVYTGKELEQIAMPMGGIGCGQLYLGGKGDIVSWQILNNFNTGAQVAGPNFAIWAKAEGGEGAAKVLAEGERDGLPGFEALRFSGEYPFAWIDYTETRGAWPVKARLECYSPMVPLDAETSGLPAVAFRFEIENPTDKAVDVSLLGALPNLCGWDGYGTLPRPEHPDFAAHENHVAAVRDGAAVVLSAMNGARDRLDKAISLVTNDGAVAQRMRLLGNVRVSHGDTLPAAPGDRPVVYWAGDFVKGGNVDDLRAAVAGVAAGAGLVIAGMDEGLLAVCATQGKRRRAKNFEDWERGGFDGWELEGNCFGPRPHEGTLPGQQPVSGMRGKFFVNSFFNGDDAQGVATSRVFTLRHGYIHLLVGGGAFPGEACVNLIVDGARVRTATGENTEQLKRATWDVAEFAGKQAQIEVVDRRTGGWGHVLLDDIAFSNTATDPFSRAKAPREVLDALPVRWSRIARHAEAATVSAPGQLHPALQGAPVAAETSWRLSGMRLKPGAEVLLRDSEGRPLVIAGTHGKGRVVLCLGSPQHWSPWLDHAGDRALIAAIVARAAGATYHAARPGDTANVAVEDQIASMPHHGSMALGVDDGGAQVCAQWNDFSAVWKQFSADGGLPAGAVGPSAPGRAWNAALAARRRIEAGATHTITFTVAWHFPNRTRTAHYGWGPGAYQYDYRLGNHYNNRFKDAGEVLDFAAANAQAHHAQTRAFHAAFYATTLPRYFLDAITANISILRSPIYVWLEDGTVGGFEGSDSCCPMNCTHVYNYAMTMPYLFPALERNVRELDLLVNRDPVRNFVPHRTALPLSVPRLGDEIGGPHHHALDGELGAILKLYREWKMCGDRAWLEKTWAAAKLVMRHVLDDHDVVKDGVLRGEQPNTYDTHLFGSNMFIGGLYLGALRAAEELARVMGDEDFAITCRARYEKGHRGYEGICWNGEYYFNVFNAPDATPETYNNNNCYGDGCHADQVLGQWWAHHLGLGHLCDPGRAKTMLASIYKYNWRRTLKDHVHTQRVFAQGDEKGLLIITWPRGKRPERPILYCDEVWTGIEYEVACAMLHEGMVTEALQIVRGARDRYTGSQRNPWSEIECGGHYARAMSAYGLLHAAGGLDYDAGAARLRMAPRVPGHTTSFFTAGNAWGTLTLAPGPGGAHFTAELRQGSLELRELELGTTAARVKAPRGHRASVEPAGAGVRVTFDPPLRVSADAPLSLALLAK